MRDGSFSPIHHCVTVTFLSQSIRLLSKISNSGGQMPTVYRQLTMTWQMGSLQTWLITADVSDSFLVCTAATICLAPQNSTASLRCHYKSTLKYFTLSSSATLGKLISSVPWMRTKCKHYTTWCRFCSATSLWGRGNMRNTQSLNWASHWARFLL